MEELYSLGLSEDEIHYMKEINPELEHLSNEEIIEKATILRELNCSDTQISNIIGSNPMFLNKTNTDITSFINYLIKLGFTSLNILFDSNPCILNIEDYEIKDYVDKRIINGEKLEDIVDDMDANPYLFNEL
jgi:hypothetical protein